MTSQERQGFGNGGISAGTYGTGAMFDETTANALRIARRRKWTLIGVVVFLVAIGAGAIIGSNISSNRQKDVANEYLGIESEYFAVTKAFQESMGANMAANPFAQPDYSAVAKKFADFATANVSTPLGWDAALRAARMYIDQKNLPEAKRLLEPLVTRTLKHNLMQIKVRRTLAGIYAENGEFDKAIAELEFCEKNSRKPNDG